MRQLCNVAYVAQLERLDEKDAKHFLRELNRRPGAAPISRGVNDLMATFKMQGR